MQQRTDRLEQTPLGTIISVLVRSHYKMATGLNEFHLRHPASDDLDTDTAPNAGRLATEEDIITALMDKLPFEAAQAERGWTSLPDIFYHNDQWDQEWAQYAARLTCDALSAPIWTKAGACLRVSVVDSEQDASWLRGTDFQRNVPRVEARFLVKTGLRTRAFLGIRFRPSTLDLSYLFHDPQSLLTLPQRRVAVSDDVVQRVTREAVSVTSAPGAGEEEHRQHLRDTVAPVLTQRLLATIEDDSEALVGASLFFEDISDRPTYPRWLASRRVRLTEV